VTVLDACAVIALFKDEAGADQVASILVRGEAELTPIGLAEVVDQVARVYGEDPDDYASRLALLGLIAPPPMTAPIALDASLLRARHYHRTRRAVSLADCVAAATAQRLQRPLATSDPALLDLCSEEGIPYLALPGSDGTRHTPS